jgi:hypothetical protein
VGQANHFSASAQASRRRKKMKRTHPTIADEEVRKGEEIAVYP